MNFYRDPHDSVADCKAQLSECRRCGHLGFERLKSYGHCANCLYFEDYDEPFLSIDLTMKAFRDVFLTGDGGRKTKSETQKFEEAV